MGKGSGPHHYEAHSKDRQASLEHGLIKTQMFPDGKVHGANMGPI